MFEKTCRKEEEGGRAGRQKERSLGAGGQTGDGGVEGGKAVSMEEKKCEGRGVGGANLLKKSGIVA